jgi:hypothetical protein
MIARERTSSCKSMLASCSGTHITIVMLPPVEVVSDSQSA